MRNLVQIVGILSCLHAACDDVRNPEFCGDGFCIDDNDLEAGTSPPGMKVGASVRP